MKSNSNTPLFILCIIFWTSCNTKDDTFRVRNLNNNVIALIGHGGSGFTDATVPYPANAMSSLTNAIVNWNADGVETDLQLSSNGTVYNFHDEDMGESTLCSGRFRNQEDAYIDRCKFKVKTGANSSIAYPIAKLEDVLTWLSGRKTKPLLFLELKVPGYTSNYFTVAQAKLESEKTVNEVVRLLQKYQAFSYSYVQSLDEYICLFAAQKEPRLRVLYDGPLTTEKISQSAIVGWYGLASKSEDASEEEILMAHQLGLRIQLYGVAGQMDVLKAIQKNPDFLLVENVLQAQRILSKTQN